MSPTSFSLPSSITLDDDGPRQVEAGPSTPHTVPGPRPTGNTLNPPPKLSQPVKSPGLSPILTAPTISAGPLAASQPQYAEDFTPLKLRKRRRAPQQPGPGPVPGGYIVGSSVEGYYTEEGDLYRGAVIHPIAPTRTIEDDAITLGGSSSTSSSSSSSAWSWASGLSAGRRAKAVIDRVGEALRVRRGSGSSTSDSDDGPSGEGRQSANLRRSLSTSRTRSRRFSRSANDTGDKPKRVHQPKRREFTLLLPPDPTQDIPSGSRLPTPQGSISETGYSTPPNPPESDRVIVTPSLPVILERIRTLRSASGIWSSEASDPLPIPRRGGSAPGRSRRPKPRQTPTASFLNPPVLHPKARSRLQVLREQSMPELPKRPKSVSDIMDMTGLGGSSTSLSGMRKVEFAVPPPSGEETKEDRKGKGKGCWWLDVSCPAWEDLRDLGELLGLHPLTLEDILQQDPREKLDTFDSLGYYFLVVRALDEGYFKYTPGSNSTLVGSGKVAELEMVEKSDAKLRVEAEEKHREATEVEKEGRRRGWGMGRGTGRSAKVQGEKVEIVEDQPGKEGLEGVGVGALNVYLVVFQDGVMSFHFDDISQHTKRVLNRVLSNASARGAPGSDWIAHGLLDSIVDAFFPLIRYVDGEVDDIDSLTVDPTTDPKKAAARSHTPIPAPRSSETLRGDLSDKANVDVDEKRSIISEKPEKISEARKPDYRIRHRFLDMVDTALSVIPPIYIHVPRPMLYLKLFFLPVTNAVRHDRPHGEEQAFDRSTMLKRITDMRKLVTGLARTLGAKHQVVGKLRKRAKESGGGVEAYIGDVEDHILLLQTSLYHYEYILSHCQPAYLSHLSVSATFAREATSQAILALSTVTIGILPMQLVLGLFSMNVHVPHNGNEEHEEDDESLAPFNWFAGIVIFIFLVACCVVTVVRWWRWQARVKWAGLRGAELPEFWEGFWGWK